MPSPGHWLKWWLITLELSEWSLILDVFSNISEQYLWLIKFEDNEFVHFMSQDDANRKRIYEYSRLISVGRNCV